MLAGVVVLFLFFFNDTATTEIYTLSLHDALPISAGLRLKVVNTCAICRKQVTPLEAHVDKSLTWLPLESTTPKVCADRKSTRLNSSHGYISYAVFCLKKKSNRGISLT